MIFYKGLFKLISEANDIQFEEYNTQDNGMIYSLEKEDKELSIVKNNTDATHYYVCTFQNKNVSAGVVNTQEGLNDLISWIKNSNDPLVVNNLIEG